MHSALPVPLRAPTGGTARTNAILAGILATTAGRRNSVIPCSIAAERGLSYEFVPEDISGAHPNTARIYYECDNGKQGMVEGASIGGGNIQITNIDGMEVNFDRAITTPCSSCITTARAS